MRCETLLGILFSFLLFSCSQLPPIPPGIPLCDLRQGDCVELGTGEDLDVPADDIELGTTPRGWRKLNRYVDDLKDLARRRCE